jgi:hypothetical protein
LLIAAIPNFGDPAIDYAKYFHAANGGLGAVLELYRRLIDDRHVFPVVACDHEVQIEAKFSTAVVGIAFWWTALSDQYDLGRELTSVCARIVGNYGGPALD